MSFRACVCLFVCDTLNKAGGQRKTSQIGPTNQLDELYLVASLLNKQISSKMTL